MKILWKYCGNISQNFLFFISFVLSQPSSYPYVFFFFLLFFSSTRCHLYLLLFALSSSFNNIPSFQLVQVQFSFSSALSIFFFFLTWFQRALWTKYSSSVFHSAISSRFGETKFVGPGENFLPDFPLSLFSSLSQIVENNVFHSVFPLYVFHPP